MSRRQALRMLAGTAAACAVRPLSFLAATRPTAGLGVCSISYLLRWPKVDRGQAPIEETLEFISRCQELGASGVQTHVRPEPGFTRQIREKINSAGMYLEAQVALPRADSELERFEAEVIAAREAGVKVLRTACLGGRRYETFTDRQAFQTFAEHAEQALVRAEAVVRKHQVRLAVENHKDWRIPEMLALLHRLSSEYVGVCVDTGNSIALLEDPMAVVEAYAPFAFSTHLKDMAVQEYEKGFLLSEVPLGEGFLDLPAIVRTLRTAQPDLHFNLEMITRDPLQVPCLARPYWASSDAFPAWRLAGALTMVRTHSSKQPLPVVSTLAPDQKLEFEDNNVRKSLAYARTVLQL